MNQHRTNKGSEKLRRMNEVLTLYNDGVPQKEIAEMLNLSPSRVSQIIKEILAVGTEDDMEPSLISVVISKSQVNAVEDLYGHKCIPKLIAQFINDLINEDVTINYGTKYPSLHSEAMVDNTSLTDDMDYHAPDLGGAFSTVDEVPQVVVEPEETVLAEHCPNCNGDNIITYEDEGVQICNDCLTEIQI